MNNTLLNNQWVIEDIWKEIKKFLDSNENKEQVIRTCGTQS
jgi:hypothetical protein